MAIEIDETRLNNLNAIAQIADGLMKNPKARQKYLEAVKETYPNVSIPEIDVTRSAMSDVNKFQQAVVGELKKMRDEMAKEREATQIAGIKGKFANERQKLIEKHNYTSEGADKLIEMMEQKGITDFDDARKIFEFDNPRPAPGRPSRGNMFDMVEQKNTGDEYIKKLFEAGRDSGAHEQLIDGKIKSVLDETRQAVLGR